jgi:hypothetical protein
MHTPVLWIGEGFFSTWLTLSIFCASNLTRRRKILNSNYRPVCRVSKKKLIHTLAVVYMYLHHHCFIILFCIHFVSGIFLVLSSCYRIIEGGAIFNGNIIVSKHGQTRTWFCPGWRCRAFSMLRPPGSDSWPLSNLVRPQNLCWVRKSLNSVQKVLIYIIEQSSYCVLLNVLFLFKIVMI